MDTQEAKPEPATDGTTNRRTLPSLRDIPTSQRHFSKHDLSHYLQLSIEDRTHDGTNSRRLPPNEVMALALNEIAVAAQYGFYYFLPNRNVWAREKFDPESRGTSREEMDSSLPALVFQNFEWTERGRATYLKSSHRTRYMACDFHVNRPPSSTPLYGFQIVSDSKYPLWGSKNGSFVIFQASALYFGAVADIEGILGRKKPRGDKKIDPHLRLATTGLWDGNQSRLDRLDGFKYTSLRSMHDAIARACSASSAMASFTSGQLLQRLPRPAHPEMGIPLGTELCLVPARRGGGLDLNAPSRQPAKRQQDDASRERTATKRSRIAAQSSSE